MVECHNVVVVLKYGLKKESLSYLVDAACAGHRGNVAVHHKPWDCACSMHHTFVDCGQLQSKVVVLSASSWFEDSYALVW